MNCSGGNMAKIIIQKRSLPEWLTCLIVVFPFCLGLILQLLKLPSVLKYVMDVAWVSVLAITLMQQLSMKRQVMPFLKLILLYFLYTIITYLFNYQSIIYYLWGFRNNFRYYVAFLAFAVYLRERDSIFFLKLMDKLFWINALLVFFQFFVLGLKQDYLGGIFGVERGCNGYSILFLGLMVCKTMLTYMNGQEKGLPCFLMAAVSLAIAAMAELKMFFLLFVLIMLLSALYTKFSMRKFWLMLVASLLVMAGSTLLTAIFGDSGELSFEKIKELIFSPNYSTAEDLGRFTAIPTISRRFLTNLPARLFGMGLGNCETSSFAICNTPFFQTYSYLHYTWFASAHHYLETGYIGLGLNLAFFVISYFSARKMIKSGSGKLLHCQLAMIMSVICVVLTFYNSSLRTEAGYIAYFILSLPYIRKDFPKA